MNKLTLLFSIFLTARPARVNWTINFCQLTKPKHVDRQMQNMYIVHRMASVLQHLEPRAFFMWDDSKKVCLLIKQALFIHQCIDGASVLTLYMKGNIHSMVTVTLYISDFQICVCVCVCKNGVCPIRASCSLLPQDLKRCLQNQKQAPIVGQNSSLI